MSSSSTTSSDVRRRGTTRKEDDLQPSQPLDGTGISSIRRMVQFSQECRFDIKTLPADMQRVYKILAAQYGEDYALQWCFTVRTAVELHRAWHMTLLTSKILQQLKDRFRLRMTWNLGVFNCTFRLEDGGKELYRRVPYDYDSENQDIYMRIAIALMDGHITVHEALQYQSETKQGQHTARSGLFLRDFPGRLVLYPGVAATCAVIFFGGDWTDFGIAALCGLASGLVEYLLVTLRVGILIDVMVGTVTGVIGGLFYRYMDDDDGPCLSAIFLGTLYWFFYGTAFVIGLLEIIAGELETGVTRFIAVSVKTFVLCLGAAFGLLVVGNATEAWFDQADNCGRIDLADEWWRIPLYLACSVAVLGQYRFPIVRYWRALIVMWIGYEVQYQGFEYFASVFDRDNLDTAISNVFGAAASVVSACGVSWYVNQLRYYHNARILRSGDDAQDSFVGKCIFHVMAFGVRFGDMIGLGRASDRSKLDLKKKLSQARRDLERQEQQDDNNGSHHHHHQRIPLEPAEQNLIIELLVGVQDMNIWSILMPALYQLVPGSMIARLWFGYIFPPKLEEEQVPIPGSDLLLNVTREQLENNNGEGSSQELEQLANQTALYYTKYNFDEQANNVFAGLMIIATSLALGVVFGFAVVQILEWIFTKLSCGGKCFQDKLKTRPQLERAKSRRAGMYSTPATSEQDPELQAMEFRQAILEGATTTQQADAIFNAVDFDQSDTIDLPELTDYMLNAGLSRNQIEQLFASMDHDESGQVSRFEFRRAILDKANAGLMVPAASTSKDLGGGDSDEDGEDNDNKNGHTASAGGNSLFAGNMEEDSNVVVPGGRKLVHIESA